MPQGNRSINLSRTPDKSLDQDFRSRDCQELKSEGKASAISTDRRNVRWHVSFAAAVTVASWVITPIATYAQANPANPFPQMVSSQVTSNPSDVENYWTADKILNANPINIKPQLASDGRPMAATTPTAASTSQAVKSPGSAPSLSATQATSKILISQTDLQKFQANRLQSSTLESSTNVPDAFSPIGATFTTSQVFPTDATTTYPYSTVGALYFTDYDERGPQYGTAGYFCSASVIRPRVVATAGHCVAFPNNFIPGVGAHFHWNFYFIPAFRNGAAPFGVFTPYWVSTTGSWYYGDGSVPNAQDVGLLDMNDNSGYKLGQWVGWLGYWTQQLSYNNVTMLGYPCNLDGCELLEANYAQTYEYGGNNTYIFGSNFGPGSSGCPYIRDFGWTPGGAISTEGGNWLIAVNSYGPVNLGYLYSGASNLDDEFTNMLTGACNAGGC